MEWAGGERVTLGRQVSDLRSQLASAMTPAATAAPTTPTASLSRILAADSQSATRRVHQALAEEGAPGRGTAGESGLGGVWVLDLEEPAQAVRGAARGRTVEQPLLQAPDEAPPDAPRAGTDTVPPPGAPRRERGGGRMETLEASLAAQRSQIDHLKAQLAAKAEAVAQQQQQNGTLVAKIEQREHDRGTLLAQIAAIRLQLKTDDFGPPPWISSDRRCMQTAEPRLLGAGGANDWHRYHTLKDEWMERVYADFVVKLEDARAAPLRDMIR